MTWQGYPKEVAEKLAVNSSIRDAIHNMIQRDFPIEAICRVTGAPYEVVDSQMRKAGHQSTGKRTESELREMSERMTKSRKAPRVVKPEEWGPIAKKIRTPEQQEAMRERMAKAREARGKKDG